ncbi:MAG: HEAT repeat domain-containing protein [Planctomycetota bacterium]|nr:HEAT repeat domain-containing protein [Planctomycetota bacterium]
MRANIIVAACALLVGFLIGKSNWQNPPAPRETTPATSTTLDTTSPSGPLAEEQQPIAKEPEPASEDTETETPQTKPRPSTGAGPASAEQLLGSHIQKQDFEAIWQLAFDLIAAGHYEAVDRLYEQFADAFHGGSLDSPLWKAPDFYTGNLMREYADNEIAVLSYMGHLAQLENPGELLGDLRLEMFEGEAAPMLLGFHEGRNPELVAQWLPYYQERIENWQGTSFRNREIILTLGHIPVEESALLLQDILSWAGSAQRLDVVRALGRNGTAPARDTLMAISRDDPNPTLRRAATEALELLQQR